MYNETTRLVRVIEVPLVADENEDVLVDDGTKSGATKEPVRGESDDEQTGVSYKLSDTAENLWIAYEVVAEYTDDTGKTHYAQLAKKEIANGSVKSDDAPKVFRFTFDSGDEFECENADDYPTLTNGGEGILAMTGTVPYGAGGGGTGGGGYATATLDGSVFVLDKTWKEIKDGRISVIVAQMGEEGIAFFHIYEIKVQGGQYYILSMLPNTMSGSTISDFTQAVFATNSENGYPSMTIG